MSLKDLGNVDQFSHIREGFRLYSNLDALNNKSYYKMITESTLNLVYDNDGELFSYVYLVTTTNQTYKINKKNKYRIFSLSSFLITDYHLSDHLMRH